MGSMPIVQRFKFISSSDSTTPFFPAKHGRIQTDSCGNVYFGEDVDNEKHSKEAFVNMLPSHKMLIEQEVRQRGFTIEDMYTNISRQDYQIIYWKEKTDKIQR